MWVLEGGMIHDGLRIEDDDVGEHAFAQQAATAQAEAARKAEEGRPEPEPKPASCLAFGCLR